MCRWYLVNKTSESASLCCSWVWLILEPGDQVIASEHSFHWGGAGRRANMTSTVLGREGLILTPDQNFSSNSFLISSIRKVKSALFKTNPPSLNSHLCYALLFWVGRAHNLNLENTMGCCVLPLPLKKLVPTQHRRTHSLSFKPGSVPTYGRRR